MTEHLSDAARKDASMVGTSGYARSPLDFYPTPARATQAFLEVFEDDLEGMVVWEPFCGTFAITNLIAPLCRAMLNTDIKAYEGAEPDLLVDFFSINTPERKWTGTPAEFGGMTLREIADAADMPVPDAIITNPPYEDGLAFKSVRHALELMEPHKGFVAMLLRKEFDSAKKHRGVFKDHPAFAAKVDLLHRPRWIADSTGAPRHNYSWFCWDWSKALRNTATGETRAGLRPELYYAGA